MSMQTSIRLLAGVALLIMGACGGKSIDQACDEAAEQNCLVSGIDCSLFSPAFERLVEESECSSELDDVEDCLGEFDNICDEMCGAEGVVLGACLDSYCNATQDPLCLEVAAGGR